MLRVRCRKNTSSKQYDKKGGIKDRMQTQESRLIREDSSRSGNDNICDDTDIRPIYDEEPMAEGFSGKSIRLLHKKVDSEPPHGSNVDITSIHECKQISGMLVQSMVAEKADISETIVKVDSQMMEYSIMSAVSQQFRPQSSMVRLRQFTSVLTPVHQCFKTIGMDTLSKVSEYLNNLEAYLDDGNSLEARKGKVEKSEKELEMFEALEHKSVVVELEKHRVVVFTKAPLRAYSKPFMRFSTPCGVDGQGAWDTKLDMADSHNYMTKEMLDKLGFVRIDYEDYERKMVKEVRVEIHGFIFLVDFVVIGYANEGEPLVIFGRDFLVTTKSKVDFGMGEMRIYLSMLEEERDIDALLVELVETMDEVGSSN
ncbi:hypothetical protein Tco_0343564 [Tanacetum coccineum]